MTDALAALVGKVTGQKIERTNRFAGGDISGATEVELGDGSRVVAKMGPVVDVEARMLLAMAESEARVPEVLGCEDDVLLIEYLPGGGSLTGDAWHSLAAQLGALDDLGSEKYGWEENYALRDIVVENGPCEDWPTFWAERRLLCHVPHLPPRLARRVEELAKALPELLPARPRPVLVHGDLWGGNVIVDNQAHAALIDPCAYYGDREVDAASLTLFDHPPQSFFDALDLEPGWQERQPIYRLWMWLLHVRLFGRGYVDACNRELDRLGL